MFPATAAFAWAVLTYVSIDFGFLNRVMEISPGNEQLWARRHRGRAGHQPAGVPVRLSEPQSLAPAIFPMASWPGCLRLAR